MDLDSYGIALFFTDVALQMHQMHISYSLEKQSSIPIPWTTVCDGT